MQEVTTGMKEKEIKRRIDRQESMEMENKTLGKEICDKN